MLREKTGTSQMPAIELPDGRFMTDTTPMIDFLEQAYSAHQVIPGDPVQRFVSKLLEDYAEEWLWRPAMHYRWSYPAGRYLLSRKIADELMAGVPAPGVLKRAMIRYRQHVFYVKRDGVSQATWAHVESIYLNTLDRLEDVFRARPFLLGDRPSLADFGFFASMFRHFSQDPTPADIMRERAPGVFEWQARLWHARASDIQGELQPGVPADVYPFLEDAANNYLPYLNANTRAFQQRASTMQFDVEGVRYLNVPVSQYRVWCLQELRRHFDELPAAVQHQTQALLEQTGCWAPFSEIEAVVSGYNVDHKAPFAGQKVHYDNNY